VERWLGKYSEPIYAIMRVVIGLLFICHGTQKVFGMFGGQVQLAHPRLFTAGVIEIVAGALMTVGLWTSYAAFISSGEMAVAYFTTHAPGGFWPILNRGESAVLYCFIFLYLASRGSGRLSLDALMRRDRLDRVPEPSTGRRPSASPV
jgi:putative oxidoreductase